MENVKFCNLGISISLNLFKNKYLSLQMSLIVHCF